jgi:hypothetical protein
MKMVVGDERFFLFANCPFAFYGFNHRSIAIDAIETLVSATPRTYQTIAGIK